MQAESKYLCGRCGKPNIMDPRTPVKCTQCGYRVLIKKRERRLVQLKAR